MTSKFSFLEIAVVLQALCWGIIVNELVGRLKGNNFYLATLLISTHRKKILPRMGIIWYERDLGVVYRKVPKAFGIKHSCSAESKSDAGLYYWGKQSEAKPRRGWSCYIRHHLHCIKNAVTPIVSCSSGCNCSWNKGTKQDNQNDNKFQTVKHWNVGKCDFFFNRKKKNTFRVIYWKCLGLAYKKLTWE